MENLIQDTNAETTLKSCSGKPSGETTAAKRAAEILMNVVTAICILALISCALSYFSNGRDASRMSVFGHRFVFVLSESMEPTIMTHALCLIKVTDDVDIGDIIVYEYAYDDGSSINIIHRIIEENEGGYITKGDNNESADAAPVTQEQVIGKVVCCWNWTADLIT